MKNMLNNPWVVGSASLVAGVILAFGINALAGVRQVKPNFVDLSFEKSGMITKLNFKISEKVNVGDVVAEIDSNSLNAAISTAKSNLKLEKSKLAELQLSVSKKQIALDTSNLVTATKNFRNATSSLVLAIQNAYSVSDEAVRNKVDQFFVNPESGAPSLIFNATDTMSTSLLSGRVEVETRLQSLKSALANLKPEDDMQNIIDESKRDLGEIQLFMDNADLVLNSNIQSTTTEPQPVIDKWKTDTSSARTNVGTAITSFLVSCDKLSSAEVDLSNSKKKVALDNSRDMSNRVVLQQDAVDVAQSALDSAQNDLNETYLKAPINGVITRQNVKVGDEVIAGEIIVSITTPK